MTNELEKQFFDTFGIEPKLNSPCEHLLQNKYCSEDKICRDPYFEPFPYCVGFENCTKDYKTRVWFYPKITDRILLELICIINQSDAYLHGEEYYFEAVNYKDLKEEVIAKCKRLADKNAFSEVTGEHIKHQVRTLFEEG